MQDITTEQYRVISQDNQKKIIIFSAQWCSPCRMFKPVLEKISKELEIPFYMVNVDESQDLAAELNIRSVPTTFLYNSAGISTLIQGVKSEAEIKTLLD